METIIYKLGGKTTFSDKIFEMAFYIEQITIDSWVCCKTN